MCHPLVSIIIPFYNVRDCVTYCVGSALAQDFDDYEVICVDDGSTDDTGDLLDKLAATDARIKVVHKSNGGLSDARNVGVDNSRGRFISFVDGDDLMSPHYLTSLVAAMPAHEKALVVGMAKSMKMQDVMAGSFEWAKPSPATTLTREMLCSALLTKRIGTIAVAKLAPRELYEANRFPVGVRYEELRTIASFVKDVEVYRYVKEPIYGYVMREGSIVWSSNPTVQQVNEYLEAIDISSNSLRDLSPQLENEYAFYRAVMLTRVHDFINRGLDCQDEQKQIERGIRHEVRKRLLHALKAKGASYGQKARVSLYAAAPQVYDKAIGVYNRRVKGL